MAHSKGVEEDMALSQEAVGDTNSNVALKRRAADHTDLRPEDVGDTTPNPVTCILIVVKLNQYPQTGS